MKIFSMFLKINEKRMNRLALKVIKLKEAFNKMEEKITSDIESIELKSNNSVDFIDRSIADLRVKRAMILDEKDKALNELSHSRNEIIKVRKNMFGEVEEGA
ncbi:MAG: hypothetical protein ACRC7S_09060 [Cetobacterium sp.]